MKTKLILREILGSLILLATVSQAQTIISTNAGTNMVTFIPTPGYQGAVAFDRAQGERAVLPPGLKEKMKLTDQQRLDVKPIEEEFAVIMEKYAVDNKVRIDAALEANRRARASKDKAEIRAGRKVVQDVWVGLQRDRMVAVIKVKALLTPVQLAILEDPKNQWNESHLDEANDPSSVDNSQSTQVSPP